MKPTDNQKEICDYIISEAKFWKESNDISSPTHNGDIVDFMNRIDLTEEQEVELEYLMLNLLNFVRKIDE